MDNPDVGKKKEMTRRDFVRVGAGCAGLLAGAVAGLGAAAGKLGREEMVWQLDPDKCVQCGRCATACVLSPSAVKCVHAYDVCGYCDLCGGYHQLKVKETDTAAENQLCPTAAIRRTFVEGPYYEYTIIEELCIGCAKCVKGCTAFGNGSLYLQVRHDRCVNCNECAIAKTCPGDAYRRVPVSSPYILKGGQGRAQPTSGAGVGP